MTSMLSTEKHKALDPKAILTHAFHEKDKPTLNCSLKCDSGADKGFELR